MTESLDIPSPIDDPTRSALRAMISRKGQVLEPVPEEVTPAEWDSSDHAKGLQMMQELIELLGDEEFLRPQDGTVSFVGTRSDGTEVLMNIQMAKDPSNADPFGVDEDRFHSDLVLTLEDGAIASVRRVSTEDSTHFNAG